MACSSSLRHPPRTDGANKRSGALRHPPRGADDANKTIANANTISFPPNGLPLHHRHACNDRNGSEHLVTFQIICKDRASTFEKPCLGNNGHLQSGVTIPSRWTVSIEYRKKRLASLPLALSAAWGGSLVATVERLESTTEWMPC